MTAASMLPTALRIPVCRGVGLNDAAICARSCADSAALAQILNLIRYISRQILVRKFEVQPSPRIVRPRSKGERHLA